MKKMIFDCERMKYPDTGLYHYCLNLGRHIQKQLHPDTECLSFFAPPGVKSLFSRKSHFIPQHSLQKFLMPQLGKYVLWHGTYQNTDYLPVRNRNIKVLLSVHDLNFLYENKPENKKARYLRHLQHNINRADGIVCISDYCLRDLLSHCHLGNKPFRMIHNGSNTLKRPLLDSRSYKPAKPFLFSIGVMQRKKNFHTLLPLLQGNNDLELLIAGRPDDLDYLHYIRETARRLQVEDRLRVLGRISEEEKSWYFENCYAFTLPSLAEGFGLPVAEAMSAGKPLFLSGKTALPEIGSRLAFYFNDFSADRMQRVFQQGMYEYTRGNMQSLIRQEGARFCWNKAAKAYIEFYRLLTADC